jgi:hypothetical protein
MKINLIPSPITIAFMLIAMFAILFFAPLLTIWSLNALFPVLAIKYNFYTWLAALWLGAVLSGGLVVRRKE